jgi:hypothetical protein
VEVLCVNCYFVHGMPLLCSSNLGNFFLLSVLFIYHCKVKVSSIRMETFSNIVDSLGLYAKSLGEGTSLAR